MPTNPPPELRPYTRTAAVSVFGRSYCYITCPYCNAEVKAYIWSLCGGGKRCPCGAVHGGYGMSRKDK